MLEKNGVPNREVQGTMGGIVFYILNMTNNCSGVGFGSIEELKRNNWKIKNAPQEPKKMTVSEIAKALGHEVEIVKEDES